jgi:hypothetical protein
MAIATATAIGLGISAAGSASQIIQGANAKSQADQAATTAANQLARIQEADKFKSLQVPTLGTELAQQNIQARQAQQLQGLQEGGAATVLGGLTALEQQSRAQDLQLAGQVDEMQYQRDAMLAQNAQQIEQNRAQREGALASARLQGAQTRSAQAEGMTQAGIAGLGQIGGQFALASLKGSPLYDTDTNKGLNSNGTVTPQQAAVNAQKAFAPQIASMRPNVPATSAAPQLQANYMTGLRGAQSQYEASQLAGLRAPQENFDSQYTWDPYNNQWIQNAPY